MTHGNRFRIIFGKILVVKVFFKFAYEVDFVSIKACFKIKQILDREYFFIQTTRLMAR